MLITIIVMTSVLLACNNDNEDYSEELKYTYEFGDITDIDLDIDHLEIKIDESQTNELIVKSNIEIDESNNDKLAIFNESNKVNMHLQIPKSKDNNLFIQSKYLIINISNIDVNSVDIESEFSFFFIENITTRLLKLNIIWANDLYQCIQYCTIDSLKLKFEKAYPYITKCNLNAIEIINNQYITHFSKCNFNELSYNSINGKIFMELDPDYGYTFDYKIKTYWSAFEPDQSNPGYYLYGDGERKVNVDAPKGDMEIVKYR